MIPRKIKEYVKMKLSDFPESVISHYNLGKKATPDGFVYVAIKRGMYGLPQSGILAQTLLEKRLNTTSTTRARLHPVRGHMNGALSASRSSWKILE